MLFLHVSPLQNHWNHFIWALLLGGGVNASDGTQIFHHIFMGFATCGKLAMALPNDHVFLCLGACWLHRTRPHYANQNKWLKKLKWVIFEHKTSPEVPKKCPFQHKILKKLYWAHFGDLFGLCIMKYRQFRYFFVLCTQIPKPRPLAHLAISKMALHGNFVPLYNDFHFSMG